ncbi:Farnesol dehydrogenase [Blattella germanica]|nr:Farnesol dehydrogenase [Blattella germanica]
MDRWVGRVAIVTGASAGIGASISEELVKKGLKVVGLARRVEMIQSMSHELKPFFNLVLQNQLVVPVGSNNCLQQQFGVFLKLRLVMKPYKLQLLQDRTI